MQRAFKTHWGKKVWLIQIVPQAIMTENQDGDTTLKMFDLVGLDLIEIQMHILTQVHLDASKEI